MSRRKAFDTGLSTAQKSAPSTTTSAPKVSMPSRVQRAPSISSPDHPHAHTSETITAPPPRDDESEADDASTCFICAEPIQFWSAGVCGHRTCHVCAIRLRVFYKKKECTFCKTSTPSLLFSRSPKTPFPSEHHIPTSDPHLIAARQADAEKIEKEGKKWDDGLVLPGTLDLSQSPYADEKLGVIFEDEDMMETTLLLLRFNCPYPDCPHMASDWNSLEKHTLATHGLVLCGLCRRQLSRFAHEQVLYPPHLLPLHDPSQVKRGQRPPRPRGDKELEMVKGWEAPHPMCEFCHTAFFGPDELFKHMRGSHEECFVCKQLGERDVYFQNYGKLEQHFNGEHFPCPQPSCLEKKFIVFPSDMDLRAHMVSEHGEEMSARDRANARHVQVDFQQPSRGGERHQSRGFTLQTSSIPNGHTSRMRDSAPQGQQITQPPPMSGAQAAQHRRQVQTDRAEETSRRRRNFDTGLSSAREVREEESGGSGWNTPREDVDDATALRHQALMERLEILTTGNPNKMASFRSSVRQFKHGESNAKDMVDTVYNVLDQDTDATSGVIKEVANLFESEGEKDKVQGLLGALNAWRIEQREQFPSLASAPAALGSNYAGITSGAILNAKRSTQTHRTGGGTTVWDRVEAAAASAPRRAPVSTGGRYIPGAGIPASTSAFPALGGPSGAARPSTHSTPWSTGGAGSSSKTPPALTGPIITSVNYPVPKTKSAPLNKSAFPSLPTTGKSTAEERKALFSKGSAREESIKRVMGIGSAPPPTSSWGGAAWGGGGNAAPTNGVEDVTAGVEGLGVEEVPIVGAPPAGAGAGGGGGKKKGKQKQQLLFSVSARP